jgi:hypothetical protein
MVAGKFHYDAVRSLLNEILGFGNVEGSRSYRLQGCAQATVSM